MVQTFATCGRNTPGCCSRDLERPLQRTHTRKKHEKVECVRISKILIGVALAESTPLCCWAHGVEGGTGYVPSPMDPGWQVYVGAVIGVIPFIIATYEFGKRVIIQRRCKECGGSGLVLKGKYYKKCVACGGFLPWLGWNMFFFSSPGNGSPVMPPMSQKNKIFYSVPPADDDKQLDKDNTDTM